MTPSRPIRIAAAMIVRDDGLTLLVRKRGTACFMQPGGKIEPGEAPAAALCRELREELGLVVALDQPRPLGRFRAKAANEPGRIVEAELFTLTLSGPFASVTASAEIEEIAWVDPASPGALRLAPLTRDQVLPLCDAAPTPRPA